MVTRQFDEKNVLSRGRHGLVFKASYQDGMVLSIRCLPDASIDEGREKEVWEEKKRILNGRRSIGYFGKMTVPQLMQKWENLIFCVVYSAMRHFLIQSKPHSSVSSATLHTSIILVCVDWSLNLIIFIICSIWSRNYSTQIAPKLMIDITSCRW